jgi:hypothetical protein
MSIIPSGEATLAAIISLSNRNELLGLPEWLVVEVVNMGTVVGSSGFDFNMQAFTTNAQLSFFIRHYINLGGA